MSKMTFRRIKPGRKGFLLPGLVLCLLMGMVLSGCGKSAGGSEEGGQKIGEYEIYYTNAEKNQLVHATYKAHSEDFAGILDEVLQQFQTSKSENILSALPDGVKINQSSIGIQEVDIDFSSQYLSLGKVDEILLRAALVETLCQLPGVDHVRFTVDGQPLTIGDTEVGLMNKDSFIVPEKDAINPYRNKEIPLYFSSQGGDGLVREYRKIYYSSNINTERIVAEQIVKGPENDNLLPVTGTSVIILGARIKGDTCMIDFSKTVNDLPAPDSPVKPETALYAFVNALCDALSDQGVTGVRFTIEGSSDERFRGQVNLDQTFTPDKEIVEKDDTGTEVGGVLVDGSMPIPPVIEEASTENAEST